MFVAHRQEGRPGMNLVFPEVDRLEMGIWLLGRAALGVQLATHFLADFNLGGSATDPAVLH